MVWRRSERQAADRVASWLLTEEPPDSGEAQRVGDSTAAALLRAGHIGGKLHLPGWALWGHLDEDIDTCDEASL